MGFWRRNDIVNMVLPGGVDIDMDMDVYFSFLIQVCNLVLCFADEWMGIDG